ncbi:MAG TPA: ribosomal protein S18-alanine N-acetyltransferase, partial [Vicinamibacterales bacterium]|nr:ribosomal protein S18-alanine N-acetyltransferase [Vicinamibacterales bacterium]
PDAVLARERQSRVAEAFVEVTAPEDIAEVARLQARAFGNAWGEEALGGQRTNPSVARLYGLRLPAAGIVAYCAAWKVADELHINSLAVDPQYRRKGLARRLLQHVLATSAASGTVSATLEVRQSNEAGRALYEGLGFRVEGVRPGYYQDPREDALILWKRGLGDLRDSR